MSINRYASLLRGAALCVVIGGQASAADISFNIPRQPLPSALQAFGLQSGAPIVFDPSATRAIVSAGVIGVFDPETALRRLLAGAPLDFVRGREGFTVINVANAAARGRPAPVAPQPPQPQPEVIAQRPRLTQALSIESVAEVVVTGSRTTFNGNSQPTPVTVVSTADLTATTPSNIPDALNKLPVFSGSSGVTTLGNATSNSVGAFLNLRGFGVIRTLILQDGRRVPATAANGTVDTNTLPQLLMQRVDVVTGGASAVYGSDAVTGVVNFVLDNRFDGVKAVAQTGLSSRGDDGSYKFGLAAGRSLADDRLHVEGSYEFYRSQGVGEKTARPVSADPLCVEGKGTASSPFQTYTSCRNSNQTYGGLIRSGPLAGMTFSSNGVLTPFTHGLSTGAAGAESGGDGAYSHPTSLAASLRTQQGFARADYAFTSTVKGYLQASYVWAQNGQSAQYVTLNPNVIAATDAFLTPAQQAAASGPGAVLINGVPTFTLGKLFTSYPLSHLIATSTSAAFTAGLRGQLTPRLNWDAYYTHARSAQHVSYDGNNNNGLQYAALDAVRDPATGAIVCNVTLTNPGLYPGCIPLNPFGPAAADPAAVAYLRKLTEYTLDNTMDDVGANIAGSLFSTWAGPVRMALSGEWRSVGLANRSNAQPTDPLNCTGLRFNCTATSVLWGGNVTANMSASETIAEGALEATAPLLKDRFLADSLELNGAVRFAQYSVSGQATTYKIGLDWRISDDLSFRGTRSRDIRAPTLFDLYQPLSQNQSTFADLHTGLSTTVPAKTQGNPDLKPEVAETTTVGVVVRPSWLPRFSVAADYYKIDMSGSIVLVSGLVAQTQSVCEASNGASPLCALYFRPLPFSNRTAANYPTLVLAQPQNIARTWTDGVDFEVNYGLALNELRSSLPGWLNLRLLASYQPDLDTVLYPGQPVVNTAGTVSVAPGATVAMAVPAVKFSLGASYLVGPWTLATQVRWRSSLALNGDPTVAFDGPSIPANAVADLTAVYKFNVGTKAFEAFVTVQNLFDQLARSYASTVQAANFGGGNTIVPGDDVIGRYVTTGLRVRF